MSFSHSVSKRARVSSVSLELWRRSGDGADARSPRRAGDHETAVGDSATAASLAATRLRRTRSASSAGPARGVSFAFAGDGFAEGARETLAELGADDRAERKPSEARDGEGFGETKIADAAFRVGEKKAAAAASVPFSG